MGMSPGRDSNDDHMDHRSMAASPASSRTHTSTRGICSFRLPSHDAALKSAYEPHIAVARLQDHVDDPTPRHFTDDPHVETIRADKVCERAANVENLSY